MKKTKLIIGFIIVFCFGALFGTFVLSKIGSNSQNQSQKSNLVGTWKAVNGRTVSVMVVDNDKTFYLTRMHRYSSKNVSDGFKGYINDNMSVVYTGIFSEQYQQD